MNDFYKHSDLEYYSQLQKFPKYAISNKGNLLNMKTQQVLKWRLNDGYYSIPIRKDGINHCLKRGKTILEQFSPKLAHEKNFTCDHIDRDRTNDSLTNLRWASASDQSINRNTNRGESGLKFISTHDSKGRKWYRFSIQRGKLKIAKQSYELEIVQKFRDEYCKKNNIELD